MPDSWKSERSVRVASTKLETFFHLAPPEARESIEREGLRGPNGVYMTDDPEVLPFVDYEHPEGDADVWEVHADPKKVYDDADNENEHCADCHGKSYAEAATHCYAEGHIGPWLRHDGPIAPNNLVFHRQLRKPQRSGAANPSFIKKWVDEHGPYLYHGTPMENVDAIKAEGIRPDTGQGASDHFESRYNHVYLGTEEKAFIYTKHQDSAMFRVDIRKLDPTKLKADEDHVSQTFHRDHATDLSKARYPQYEKGYWANKNPSGSLAWHSLGHWANDAGLDDPEVVHDSLRETGTIAHEGPIPAEAVEHVRNLPDKVAQQEWQTAPRFEPHEDDYEGETGTKVAPHPHEVAWRRHSDGGIEVSAWHATGTSQTPDAIGHAGTLRAAQTYIERGVREGYFRGPSSNPHIFPVRIRLKNPVNTPETPISDTKASGERIPEGHDGLFYVNDEEDDGSISVMMMPHAEVAFGNPRPHGSSRLSHAIIKNPTKLNGVEKYPSPHGPVRGLVYRGRTQDNDMSGARPLWTTNSAYDANFFAQGKHGKTEAFHVDMSNAANEHDLLDAVEAVGSTDKDIQEHSYNDGDNRSDHLYVPKVREELKRRGFDGYRGWDPMSNYEIQVFVPFHPAKALTRAPHHDPSFDDHGKLTKGGDEHIHRYEYGLCPGCGGDGKRVFPAVGITPEEKARQGPECKVCNGSGLELRTKRGQVQRHCVECKKVFSESEHGEATGFCSSCREKEGLVTHHSWSEDAQEGHYGAKHVMYHNTSPSYRDSIREHGIDYRRMPDPDEVTVDEDMPQGNYLYRKHPGKVGGDLWEVDVDGLDIQDDPYDEQYGIDDEPPGAYTPDAIHPSRLRLIQEGERKQGAIPEHECTPGRCRQERWAIKDLYPYISRNHLYDSASDNDPEEHPVVEAVQDGLWSDEKSDRDPIEMIEALHGRNYISNGNHRLWALKWHGDEDAEANVHIITLPGHQSSNDDLRHRGHVDFDPDCQRCRQEANESGPSFVTRPPVGLPAQPGIRPEFSRPKNKVGAKDDIPSAPGTAPIPEGHVRIYHATWADPEEIKRTGLSIKKAQESYERGGTEFPAIFGIAGHHTALDNHHSGGGANVVEYHLHPDDLDIGRGREPADMEARRSTVTTMKDVPPENIVAVHEAWHSQYRMIKDDPRIQKAVLDGEHDWALTDESMKPLGDAIRKFKRESAQYNYDDLDPDQKHWMYGGCIDYARALHQQKPELRFGMHTDHAAPGEGWGTIYHVFTHDDTHAYDAMGKHPLPYHLDNFKEHYDVGENDIEGIGMGVPYEDEEEEFQRAREHWNQHYSAQTEHVDSPLEYKHDGVKRISIQDPDFPGDPKDSYFKEPGTVAFLDYTPMGDNVFIDYATTHRSQRGRGHASALIDQVYDRFPGEVNWGKIMEPAMGKLYERHRAHPEHGARTRGKDWYSSVASAGPSTGRS